MQKFNDVKSHAMFEKYRKMQTEIGNRTLTVTDAMPIGAVSCAYSVVRIENPRKILSPKETHT